jgi:hypothetical protein
MSIADKRLEEIRNLKNIDFPYVPELTDEQLRPSHYRKAANISLVLNRTFE